MAQSDEIQIFYSWQRDLSEKTNKNAIRRALRTAQNNIEAHQPGLNIVLDEATRDTSGSANIASKILETIEDADIIVARCYDDHTAPLALPCCRCYDGHTAPRVPPLPQSECNF